MLEPVERGIKAEVHTHIPVLSQVDDEQLPEEEQFVLQFEDELQLLPQSACIIAADIASRMIQKNDLMICFI